MALSDWELRDCAQPTPARGEELLCATYLCSVDPTMRNAMAGPAAVALTKQTDVGYYVCATADLRSHHIRNCAFHYFFGRFAEIT